MEMGRQAGAVPTFVLPCSYLVDALDLGIQMLWPSICIMLALSLSLHSLGTWTGQKEAVELRPFVTLLLFRCLLTAGAGLSTTSVTRIWEIFLYRCLFTYPCFWLQAFKQHQCKERETSVVVGVVAYSSKCLRHGGSVPRQCPHKACTVNLPVSHLQSCTADASEHSTTVHFRPAEPSLAIFTAHAQSQCVAGPLV